MFHIQQQQRSRNKIILSFKPRSEIVASFWLNVLIIPNMRLIKLVSIELNWAIFSDKELAWY